MREVRARIRDLRGASDGQTRGRERTGKQELVAWLCMTSEEGASGLRLDCIAHNTASEMSTRAKLPLTCSSYPRCRTNAEAGVHAQVMILLPFFCTPSYLIYPTSPHSSLRQLHSNSFAAAAEDAVWRRTVHPRRGRRPTTLTKAMLSKRQQLPASSTFSSSSKASFSKSTPRPCYSQLVPPRCLRESSQAASNSRRSSSLVS